MTVGVKECLAHRELVVAFAHLESPEIQARSFAPLILLWLLQAGETDREIFVRVANWYACETDTRGYDEGLGWLHAIAHGADCLGFCVQQKVATGSETLAVFANRVISEDNSWSCSEAERIVSAIVRILVNDLGADINCFFQPIERRVESLRATSAASASDPTWVANLRQVLNVFYICADAGAILDDHSVTLAGSRYIKSRIVSLNRLLSPWLYR